LADRTITTSSGNGNVTLGVVNSAYGLTIGAGGGTISTVAMGAGTSLAFITFSGSGINTIGGDMRSTGAIDLGSSRTTNFANSQTIRFGSSLNAGAMTIAAAQTLTLFSVSGDINATSVTGPASGTNANITFANGGAVTVSGAITTGIGTLWLNKTTGNVSFGGSLQISQLTTDASSTYNISITGSTNSIASFSTSTPWVMR
jgi:hypothetical protein